MKGKGGDRDERRPFLGKFLQKLQVGGIRGGVAIRIGELFHTDQVLDGGDAKEARFDFDLGGPVGDLFYCYAKTGEDRRAVSTFLIESEMPGFARGKKISKMGMRGSPTGELIFDNCRVPVANRVGTEGKSIGMMMRNLDLERITIAGISLGIARASIDASVQYAKDRKQFGKPIGAFQQIQERITEASAWYEACRCLTYTAAQMWDQGLMAGKDAAMMAAKAKLQSAQMATQVALDAIQIMGGYGYSREFPVERYMRDAKLMEIGAGTNEILRLIIARQMLGTVVDL